MELTSLSSVARCVLAGIDLALRDVAVAVCKKVSAVSFHAFLEALVALIDDWERKRRGTMDDEGE